MHKQHSESNWIVQRGENLKEPTLLISPLPISLRLYLSARFVIKMQLQITKIVSYWKIMTNPFQFVLPFDAVFKLNYCTHLRMC